MSSIKTKKLMADRIELRRGSSRDVTPTPNPGPTRSERRRAVSKAMRKAQKKALEELKWDLGQKKVLEHNKKKKIEAELMAQK